MRVIHHSFFLTLVLALLLVMPALFKLIGGLGPAEPTDPDPVSVPANYDQ